MLNEKHCWPEKSAAEGYLVVISLRQRRPTKHGLDRRADQRSATKPFPDIGLDQCYIGRSAMEGAKGRATMAKGTGQCAHKGQGSEESLGAKVR